MPLFKLKKVNAPSRIRCFKEPPIWSELAREIADTFEIPYERIAVTYLDRTDPEDQVTVYNQKDLDGFYGSVYQAAGMNKFIVQDSIAPDNSDTIASTWSTSSHLNILSHPTTLDQAQTRTLRCLVDDGSSAVFTVEVPVSHEIGHLKKLIRIEKEPGLNSVAANLLVLWKLEAIVPLRPAKSLAGRIKNLGSDFSKFAVEMEEPTDILSTLFPEEPSADCLHVIVRLQRADHPSTHCLPASRKRLSSLELEEGGHTVKKSRNDYHQRKWSVNGPIHGLGTRTFYYLDPADQDGTAFCLSAISDRQLVLLSGARSSGKTTRLLRLKRQIEELGYQSLYFSFERLNYDLGVKLFWKSLGNAIRVDDPSLDISTREDFFDAFTADSKKKPVVLLVDELSELYSAPDDIRNSFLRALREIKNGGDAYTIQSIIAAGTFSILHLTTTKPSVSPFTASGSVQNPYFSIEETRTLFHLFAQDNGIVIDDAVVEDVWAKSNGHPGMVCLCGRVISDRLDSLLEHESSTLPYHNWERLPVETLYSEIYAYNTFRSLIKSLRSSEAHAAVKLLRSRFAGFLGDVMITRSEEDLADFLTSQGVLLRPNVTETRYRMASPLIDGLIRAEVIPFHFPDAPSIILPTQNDILCVLDVLVVSLKFFDKELIRLAPSRSYKSSTVNVHGSRVHVPRESVYDTELMRILSIWLGLRHGWTVTGQWHLQTTLGKHKYTDIILQKEDNWPIVLELLATGDRSIVKSHIEKTPEYMDLVSAKEGWVVHFTCEDNYQPIWQTDVELGQGVNVVHFSHDLEFTRVSMWAQWKDGTGATMKTHCNVDI